MDVSSDIREFLTTRRARLKPEDVELPTYGGRRRVTGLRREEVALLAGVSVEYYTRLERGNAKGVSDEVLDGVARALRLDEAERTHLYDLIRASNPSEAVRRRRPSHERVRPTVQRVVETINAPAYVRNGRLDILAANELGRALYAPVFADVTSDVPNMARFIFLNARAVEFFADWKTAASDAVGILRAEAGRDPYDRRLSDLIGELSTRSEEFRVRWAAHNVKFHRTGMKSLIHPIVGPVTLSYEAFELLGDNQRLNVYTAEAHTTSQDALDLLASWTATVRT